MMLSVKQLTVKKGATIAVNDVDFDINTGETVCLLGRNGAGKTTLLRGIIGAEPLQSGQSLINGFDMHQPDRLQVLPDVGAAIYPNSFYNYLSATENLRLTQRYYGETRFSIDEILHRFDLNHVSQQPARQLSAGMRQRLSLALAFINRPTLLLLDEPFNAVDRENTNFIQQQLIDLQVEFNTTIILTSHSLPNVEAIYDRVLLLKKGILVADFSKSELAARARTLTDLYDELS